MKNYLFVLDVKDKVDNNLEKKVLEDLVNAKEPLILEGSRGGGKTSFEKSLEKLRKAFKTE